ncbi:hypothetical protein CBS147372_9603 [Penicillium roqueforti]|nr:hypothetical protein CBS147372_9603 [Penicillium roqueforti]
MRLSELVESVIILPALNVFRPMARLLNKRFKKKKKHQEREDTMMKILTIYDAIVVGGDNAALCAAISAHEAGARAIILGAASKEERGGNSRYAGAAFRAVHSGMDQAKTALTPQALDEAKSRSISPLTKENFHVDLTSTSHGRNDPVLSEVLVNESWSAIDWMKSKGETTVRKYYWDKLDGTVDLIAAVPKKAVQDGLGLIQNLFAAVEKTDNVVRYDAPVHSLLLNGDTVHEVRVRETDCYSEIHGAVILASGGFSANPAMKRQYLGEGWDLIPVRGTRHNTGTMLQHTIEAGAQPVGNWGAAHASPQDINAPLVGDIAKTPVIPRYSYTYAITINVNGERLFDGREDEFAMTYAKIGKIIGDQPRSIAYQIFDQKTINLLQPRYATGDAVYAQTVRRACEKAEHFCPNVDAFDSQHLDGLLTALLAIPKSNWALPLSSPPFVAYGVTCGITFTYGGIASDTRARVLNNEGRPMPGLYCTGEIAGGIFHHNYAGGPGLTKGAVFGRIAVREATQYAKAGHGREEESVSWLTPDNEKLTDTSPLRPFSVHSVGRDFVYTLGNVTITSERAQILFSTSQLLFWTIIAVSSRRIGDDLLSTLAPELTGLLWATIGGSLFSLSNVQSLLLLASWTLPDMHLWTDKSLVLANLAITAAQMMGLNRPGCESEYSKQSTSFTSHDIAERTRTWLAAVAVCQSLSTDIGNGPISSFIDLSIQKASSADGIPVELHHSLIIQKAANEALRSWDEEAAEGPYGIPDEAAGWDLIRRGEQSFLYITQQVWSHLSLANRLQLQASQLRLQCLFMLYNTSSEIRSSGILRAYETATDLINTVLSEVDACQHLSYAPSLFARYIFSAALVILRVLHSTFRIGLDYDRGQLLFNAAAFALSQLSIHQKQRDQAARTSDMLRRCWSAAERSSKMRQRDLRLRVKSRMGASLVYDCLMNFRNGNRPDVAGSAAVESNLASVDALEAAPGAALNGDGEFSNARVLSPTSDPTGYDFDHFQFTAGVDLSDMFLFEDVGYSGVP